jgi:hypothetical protein
VIGACAKLRSGVALELFQLLPALVESFIVYKDDKRKLMSRFLILVVLASCLLLLSTGFSGSLFFSRQATSSDSNFRQPRTGENGENGTSSEGLAQSSSGPAQGSSSIEVTVEQLAANNGTSPVEIQQQHISSNNSSQIDEFSYVVRNHTNKRITAITVARSITYE